MQQRLRGVKERNATHARAGSERGKAALARSSSGAGARCHHPRDTQQASNSSKMLCTRQPDTQATRQQRASHDPRLGSNPRRLEGPEVLLTAVRRSGALRLPKGAPAVSAALGTEARAPPRQGSRGR